MILRKIDNRPAMKIMLFQYFKPFELLLTIKQFMKARSVKLSETKRAKF